MREEYPPVPGAETYIEKADIPGAEFPADGEAVPSPDFPADGESVLDTESPTDGESVPDTDFPTDGESVLDTEFPTDGESVLDTDFPTDAESVLDAEFPADGESVLDTEFPTEEDDIFKRVFFAKAGSSHIRRKYSVKEKSAPATESADYPAEEKSVPDETIPVEGETAPGGTIPVEGETVPGTEAESVERKPAPAEKMQKRMRRYEHSVRDYQFFLLRLVLLLLFLWVMFFKVVGVLRMPSGDMYPRIDAGDMLLYYRLDTDVRAQDVVVLQKVTPEGNSELFVGRVVAVAGDTVDIGESGRLRVNGNSMIESNIFYDTYPYENYTEFPLTLLDGQCFVLADSRDGGSDSRYYGPVEREELLGSVITVLRRNNL